MELFISLVYPNHYVRYLLVNVVRTDERRILNAQDTNQNVLSKGHLVETPGTMCQCPRLVLAVMHLEIDLNPSNHSMSKDFQKYFLNYNPIQYN